MKAELIKIETPELALLEKSKAEQIRSTFEPMYLMLKDFEARFNELMAIPFDEITPEVCAKFKRFRLDIAKVRIETGKAKDKSKEDLKLLDKAIMGVHNILVYSVKEMEDISKEKELKFEILEQQRLEALQKERAEQLSLYVSDAFERDLSKFKDDEFQALLLMKKKEYEDRIEAERIAEEERIAKEKAEAEAREQQRLENERLKAEAEAREKEIAIERAKAEAEKQKLEAELKAKEEEAKRLAEIESARIKAEQEAKAKAEQEAKELAKAPIKVKLSAWIDGFSIPEMKEAEAQEIINKFNAFKNWAKKEIEKL